MTAKQKPVITIDTVIVKVECSVFPKDGAFFVNFHDM